jgi:ornithine decarboxylase
LGVSFDCASEAEIQAALALPNITPEHIIYANPCKPRSHIAAAAALGVHTMTFDNSDELRKMLALNPHSRLVIRLLVDDSTSVMPFGTKFGASLAEACALMDECRQLGGNLVGVAFHVGSGCLSPLAYRAALLLARAAFDEATLRGFHCSLLDIGGGFPGGAAGADHLEFDAIAAVVGPTLDELFDDDVRVIAEPGRFFCTAPFALSVVVNAARERYRSPAQLAVVNRISSVDATADADDAEFSEGRDIISPQIDTCVGCVLTCVASFCFV